MLSPCMKAAQAIWLKHQVKQALGEKTDFFPHVNDLSPIWIFEDHFSNQWKSFESEKEHCFRGAGTWSPSRVNLATVYWGTASESL